MTRDLGYDIYVDEMTSALSGVDDASKLIDQMWQSIDPLQRKLYEDKALKGKSVNLRINANVYHLKLDVI